MGKELQAVLYSLVPLFGFGIANALSKKYTNAIGIYQTLIYRGIIIVSVLFITFIAFLDESNFNLKAILGGIFLSAISYFGLYFFYKATKIGKVGLVSPVSNLKVLLASFIGIIFLNDSINTIQFISVILIFLGTILISLKIKAIKESEIFNKKSGIVFALLAALFWGATFPFFAKFSEILGAFLFSLLLETTVLFMSLLIAFKQEKKIDLKLNLARKYYKGLLFIGIISAFSSFFLNLAYKTNEISIVSAISGAGVMITMAYGGIFFKERLTKQQYIATLLIITGIIMLSYFQS